MHILLQVLILIAGFILLSKGADWFVDGAAGIAEKFGIPHIIIGLTIVAMGTSLPEASVSIASALKGSAGITIGNVLGSNIINILLILGITSLICKIPVTKNTQWYDIPFMIVITILMTVLGLKDNTLSRTEGIIMLALFALYMIYILRRTADARDTQDEIDEAEADLETEENKKTLPLWKMIVFIPLGLGMIIFGSDIAVDAATEIAVAMDIDDRIIGLTIVAFGTSLPELVTSIAAALKGKTDIAVGNIVGSNIFNILFVAGLSAVITPVAYKQSFMFDSVAAILTAILLFVCILPKKSLNKATGIIMLIGYAVYFAILI